MKTKIIGIGNADYLSKKTGKQVVGKSLHVVRKPIGFEAEGFCGLFVDTVWIPKVSDLYNTINDTYIDKQVELVYESNGKFQNLVDINILPEAK